MLVYPLWGINIFSFMDHNTVQLADSHFEDRIAQHSLVLVDCWAPWCGPCVKLGPVIDQLAILYKEKALIAKLNIDDNAQTPAKYSIKTIPTILIFHEGKLVERLVGNVPLGQIQAVLDRYVSVIAD